MNCDRCPHMKRILAALKPCQTCEAGRLHGQVGITPQTTDWAYQMRRATDHTQSAGVTATLTPDTEDAVRKVFAVLFTLEPVELLLLRHVIRGGSYASFRRELSELEKRLRVKERMLESGDSQGFRQTAHSWAKKIQVRLPMLEPVFRARIEGEI